MTVEEARQASIAKFGRDLTVHNGHVIGGAEVSEPELARHLACVAKKVVQAHLPPACTSGSTPILDLHCWPHRWLDPPATLDLDWSSFFANGSLPNPEVWQTVLLPALDDVKDGLACALGSCSVRIRAKARLSAGLALGFAFRRPSGFHLEVEQDHAVWTTVDSPCAAEPLRMVEACGDVRSKEIAVEVGVTQDTAGTVNDLVKQRGCEFRARLSFEPVAGASRESVSDGPAALAMARQVSAAIAGARKRFGSTRTHLFAAVPFGLAVFLGRELNALGEIQYYETEKGILSCVLGSQWGA